MTSRQQQQQDESKQDNDANHLDRADSSSNFPTQLHYRFVRLNPRHDQEETLKLLKVCMCVAQPLIVQPVVCTLLLVVVVVCCCCCKMPHSSKLLFLVLVPRSKNLLIQAASRAARTTTATSTTTFLVPSRGYPPTTRPFTPCPCRFRWYNPHCTKVDEFTDKTLVRGLPCQSC